jgi:hypothetical protein
MAFETFSTNDLVRIATAGGGFRLNAAGRPTDDLVRIAAASSVHNSRLTLSGVVGRSIEDLVRIGAAGKGSVFFEG